MRTRTKWLGATLCLVLLVVVVAAVLRIRQSPVSEDYRAFTSPDGRFKVVVLRSPGRFAFPGQGSDAPGRIQLRDIRSDRVIHEQRVEMVQLVDAVAWSPTNVVVGLLADWSLPQ